ncbi:uncharacterized protein RJT20DRAFT_130877 [Scheffersomyces xylosifermentans]|uniref:uncharacterized protein n=1 Tax=Scheffersomyces xylosifermentans TaxID=1304137 RepID=UPI00315D5124
MIFTCFFIFYLLLSFQVLVRGMKFSPSLILILPFSEFCLLVALGGYNLEFRPSIPIFLTGRYRPIPVVGSNKM